MLYSAGVTTSPKRTEALTAGTGIPELDRALGGLYWGDNVVWEAEDEGVVEPFYRALAANADAYGLGAYVTLTREPAEIRAAYPRLEVIDARPGTGLDQPRPLLEALRERCLGSARHVLFFDSLEAMSALWGSEVAARFFSRGCPLLLGLGAIAHWSLTPARHAPTLRREIDGITQLVLVLGEERLRVAKAEGRPLGAVGTVFRYRLEDGLPVLVEAPAAARLGTALRGLRAQRRLSQSQLAEIAGVSASAISQAERGQRGLSLDTLLLLTARLGITLDQLLRGEADAGYRLARRDDPRQAAHDQVVPLLDDPTVGLRAYVVRLPPGGSASAPFTHKGPELVAIANGLIQVVLGTGRPVLRPGETLIAETTPITGWKNLTDQDAMLFWILHDSVSVSPHAGAEAPRRDGARAGDSASPAAPREP